ncbi:hypothetical protein BGZ65_010389 [Modicella reniformis]|uniref:Protein kinase domain-containing protein n=1 Tax=Modicella reniformis TaxID=1440133 RepID=A0A9P6JG24_9FUNG|nr:hypothetical protein BGZ65_010389 [Modicella reniformis]
MAPEQQPARAADRRPYSPPKSDVWSLGIIFLNLRFGRNPWKLSRVDMDATFAAYAQDSNVLREMFPELSSSALHFLKRVLCVDPNKRADCSEALELIKRVDTILGEEAHGRDFASMEDCNEERINSELSLGDSSVGSSRSSASESSDDDDEEEEDDDEDDDDYIDSMFRMENDFGTFSAAVNNADRTNSCSSEWSLASSYQSGKSWSDMVEEEEMDFSLPVEFDETPAAPADATAAPDVCATGNSSSTPSSATLDTSNVTPNTYSDDLDDDYYNDHHHEHLTSTTLRSQITTNETLRGHHPRHGSMMTFVPILLKLGSVAKFQSQ